MRIALRAVMQAHRLHEMEWDDISEPGCYLMIASGLLARVHPEDLSSDRPAGLKGTGTRVVMLSDNPRLPLGSLRTIAIQGNYRVGF